jgi:hypothetical protein
MNNRSLSIRLGEELVQGLDAACAETSPSRGDIVREHPVAPSPVQTLELGLVDADLFVTGDQGVLACSKPPLPLVNPRSCWEQLRGAG